MVAINEKLRPDAGSPQNLPAGDYYLLQDTLYRAAAMTDSGGNIVEAYDCDAYGNTLIFTAADPSGNWWSDSATQSNFGANDIIYCGYRYDPETENYYVRNRYYSPVLGRWLTRDPIGYAGGINLYEYVASMPAGNVGPRGLQVYLGPGSGWGDNGSPQAARAPQVTGQPQQDATTFLSVLRGEVPGAAKDFLTTAAKKYAEDGESTSLSAALRNLAKGAGPLASRMGAAADEAMQVGMEALAKDLGGQVNAWAKGLSAFASNPYCASWYQQAYKAIVAAKKGDPSLCGNLNSPRNNAPSGCYNALLTSGLTDAWPLAIAFRSFAGYLANKCNKCGAKKGG